MPVSSVLVHQVIVPESKAPYLKVGTNDLEHVKERHGELI